MPYLDKKISDKHKPDCLKPFAKRLYIRDYGDKGQQVFVPWGVTCPSCGVVILDDKRPKQYRLKTQLGRERKNLDKETEAEKKERRKNITKDMEQRWGPITRAIVKRPKKKKQEQCPICHTQGEQILVKKVGKAKLYSVFHDDNKECRWLEYDNEHDRFTDSMRNKNRSLAWLNKANKSEPEVQYSRSRHLKTPKYD